MQSLTKPRRRRCEHCLRPVSHCLCAHVPSVPSNTKVLILQHPDEAKHPLNTARLAARGLQNAQLQIGTRFETLQEHIDCVDQTFLLFPPDRHTETVSTGSNAVCASLTSAGSRLLIVPDGTWRKARQIVRANPELHALPRISFSDEEPSSYRVRKAREPSAVSTIEAIVRALEVLEPEGDFKALLNPFNVLIEQQIEAMGPETYHRNHASKRC